MYVVLAVLSWKPDLDKSKPNITMRNFPGLIKWIKLLTIARGFLIALKQTTSLTMTF